MTTNPTHSKQPRLAQTKDITPWFWTVWENTCQDDIPAWGDPRRITKLREAARNEPILAGALASLVSRVVALDWQITGGRNRVRRYQSLLAEEAEDGAGWAYLLDRWAQDYLTADPGGFIELGRESRNGPVSGLYNLDVECLTLTGNVLRPVKYSPKLATGSLSSKEIPLLPADFSRIVDMPSSDEVKHGLGFCAVSRALKAAKVLLALYRYEDERLSDMPLPGIVSVTGLTQTEIIAAKQLYDAEREAKKETTFKALLWLASQVSPLNSIDVKLTSFAGLPEGFDKEKTITLYVYTLALDFGVDVREFWPASQTGATKAEAEVQAQKAKGKGLGRLISSVELAVNWQILPDGLEFRFDQQDSEDDLLREMVREKVVNNVRRLWEPAALGEGIISTEEARHWLVELGMAPAWLAPSGTVSLHSSEELEGDVSKAVGSLVDKAVAGKVTRAGLIRGEDLVTINRTGDLVTLWSPRTVFAVPNWPVPAEAPAGSPFGTLTTATAQYP